MTLLTLRRTFLVSLLSSIKMRCSKSASHLCSLLSSHKFWESNVPVALAISFSTKNYNLRYLTELASKQSFHLSKMADYLDPFEPIPPEGKKYKNKTRYYYLYNTNNSVFYFIFMTINRRRSMGPSISQWYSWTSMVYPAIFVMDGKAKKEGWISTNCKWPCQTFLEEEGRS